jgi:cytochrome b561
MLGLQELLANTLMLLAARHGLGALAHHLVVGDRTLRRMLWGTVG